MPKITLSTNEKKYKDLRRVLLGSIAVDGKTKAEIGKVLRLKDPRAIQMRMKHPENMTAHELSALGRNLGIPIADLRDAAIRYS